MPTADSCPSYFYNDTKKSRQGTNPLKIIGKIIARGYKWEMKSPSYSHCAVKMGGENKTIEKLYMHTRQQVKVQVVKRRFCQSSTAPTRNAAAAALCL